MSCKRFHEIQRLAPNTRYYEDLNSFLREKTKNIYVYFCVSSGKQLNKYLLFPTHVSTSLRINNKGSEMHSNFELKERLLCFRVSCTCYALSGY